MANYTLFYIFYLIFYILQRSGYPETIIKKFKIYMLSEAVRATAV